MLIDLTDNVLHHNTRTTNVPRFLATSFAVICNWYSFLSNHIKVCFYLRKLGLPTWEQTSEIFKNDAASN